VKLLVNGATHDVDVDPEMPLLWVLRDHLGLKATKFGCGGGHCGACTVHVDGVATRSCVLPIGAVDGPVETFEHHTSAAMDAVREAWAALDVVQCGYCQYGQMMAAAAFLNEVPGPGADEIDAAMDGNLCRCGTYQRIREAMQMAADTMKRG